jgi:photosystem II stability/assembly factor-like uncharacterized protein
LKISWLRRKGCEAVALFGVMILLVGCTEHHFEDTRAPGQISVRDDLYAATAIGSDHLWAAGYFGAIYKTMDGGRTFDKLNSGTDKSIYDISFADEQTGWAVGRRGMILHTSDGGLTWERQQSPRIPVRHIFAVHAVDTNIAWCIGDWGARYVTHDAGKTWEDVSLLVDETHPSFPYLGEEEMEAWEKGEKVYDDTYLQDIFFLNEQLGWIAAEYGLLFYTQDGGETWQKASIIGDVSFDEVPFAALDEEVPRDRWQQIFAMARVLEEKQYLRVRIEGFLTPEEYRKTGETNLADERARSVGEFIEGEGISQDRIRILNETPFDQESVDMDAFVQSKLRDHPYVVANLIETPFLFDVKFNDPLNGLAVGLGGVIMQSSDGGKTWTYRKSQSKQALYGIAAGSKAVFAAGEKGLARQSLDGGLTWTKSSQSFQEEMGIFGFMRDVVFGDPDTGWVVGAGGLVLKSEDGGQSWTPLDVVERSGRQDVAARGE